MNGKNGKEKYGRFALKSAREIALIAVFVALAIGGQFVLSAIPGIEVVTLLFVTFSYAFGVRRGVLAATAFTLLRNFLFGLFPTAFVLYLIYYNALACAFGIFRRVRFSRVWIKAVLVTLMACAFTVCFTMLDNLITPLFFGFDKGAWRAYFYASLPVMIPQIICTAVTVGGLFLPLEKVFSLIK